MLFRRAISHDLLRASHRLQLAQPLVEIDLRAVHRQDAGLLLARRVVDHELEHEAVQLGLGQVIGAFGLDGVLRGHHQERPLDDVARPLDGDAVFLHDFQQGGVRLGRRAVDLVGQQQLREDRAGTKRNSWVFMSKIGAPVMSEGMRSAVNWMRPKRQPSTRPSVRTKSVLPSPGTLSISTWPLEKRATSVPSTSSAWPTKIFSDLGPRRARRVGAWGNPVP